MALTSESLAAGLSRIADQMERSADELNGLDAQIGDGDLGVTMVRIGRGLRDIGSDLPDDLGLALMTCVQTITKISGSSYATLVATALMSAAKVCKGRASVPMSEMSALLSAAADAMMARGKTKLGDKTVIDAVDSAAKAIDGLDDGPAIVGAAATAVEATIEEMRDKPSKVGRARIFADKTIGLDDPGMVAFRYMINGLRSQG
ncbi:MAG: DAK2 domain-containing protein [Rhodospirillales bacterium]|nr:DAK2 domain-containing protein [Rhodospirillales bacterium]